MDIRDNIAKLFRQIAAALASSQEVGPKRLTWMQANMRMSLHGDNLNLSDTPIQSLPENLKVGGKIYRESLPHEPLPQITSEDLVIPGKAKELYASVSHRLDPDGFSLLHAAEDILGQFEFSHFAYEDLTGSFEDANGHDLLKYLLVDNDYKLGEANSVRSRYEIVEGTPYERCVNLTINKTTPEYRQFEETLYQNVCRRLGLVSEPHLSQQQSPEILERNGGNMNLHSTPNRSLDSLVKQQKAVLDSRSAPAPAKIPALEH